MENWDGKMSKEQREAFFDTLVGKIKALTGEMILEDPQQLINEALLELSTTVDLEVPEDLRNHVMGIVVIQLYTTIISVLCGPFGVTYLSLQQPRILLDLDKLRKR